MSTLKEDHLLDRLFLRSCVILLFGLFTSQNMFSQATSADSINSTVYLNSIKLELQKKWKNNKTINLVFHGHSVPSGYFKTPVVKTLSAYPQLVLKELKESYPYAVINCIVTGIGGENSVQGVARFKEEVLNHKPDVLFIDYAINDRRVGLLQAKNAWISMIEEAKKLGIPIILLTPSPDIKVDYSDPENQLQQHTEQIRQLAKEYQVGLADSYKAFEFLYSNKKKLKRYMAQVNHPNEKGHELIATEILKFFN